MEKEEIISILEELDLSEKEAQIYISLLQLGQTNVTRLATKSGINRVTSYHLIRSLISKGLISEIDKDNIQNFIAVNPKRLIDIAQEKQEKIISIVPELESLKETIGQKPSVQMYEGKKGISSLLEEFINNAKDKILVYGNFSIAEKAVEYESLHYRKTRINKKIKTLGITDSLEGAEFTRNPHWKKLSEIKILKSLGNTSTWIQITGSRVAILSFKKELNGILIDNEEYANTQRYIFDQLWKIAKSSKTSLKDAI